MEVWNWSQRRTLYLSPATMDAMRLDGWHFSNGWAYSPEWYEQSRAAFMEARDYVRRIWEAHDP
jgi:hypothetical protein